MKQYLQALGNIINNGWGHEDRTGVGRRSVFGVDLRFNLQEGFPLVTTKEMPFRTVIRETLWLMSGNSSITPLKEAKCNIWNQWAVRQEDIAAFIAKHNEAFEGNQENIKAYLEATQIDNVGTMYGAAWRNTPRNQVSKLWPTVPLANIASDKLETYQKLWEGRDEAQLEKDQDATFEEFASYMASQSVDQLQELIVNLRDRPFSSRHVVSAWLPEFVPFENMSPQENVLIGRGALAACHFAFQCMVIPPKEEGGKNRLSLKVSIRKH